MFLLKILSSLLVFGKCLCIKLRNNLPILLLTVLENGGSNNKILDLRFLFTSLLFLWSKCLGVSTRSEVKPLFRKASLYTGIASWNVFSLEERYDILLAIILGNSFRIVGGCWWCFVNQMSHRNSRLFLDFFYLWC